MLSDRYWRIDNPKEMPVTPDLHGAGLREVEVLSKRDLLCNGFFLCFQKAGLVRAWCFFGR